MKRENYIPEMYWDSVAAQLEMRDGNKLIAGDNDPFYVYKRKKFLKLLSAISFQNKKVVEIGSGPGGNLLEIYKQKPAYLAGTDISSRMLEICRQNIGKRPIDLFRVIGNDLPFPPAYFDIAITSTVLQHVTEEPVLTELIRNICLITNDEIYIFESIEKRHIKRMSNTGRTINEYRQLFGLYNMTLIDTRFLDVYWSRVGCGAIRKIFNSSKRKEGELQTKTSIFLQSIVLMGTKILDGLFPVKADIAMLHFKRSN